MNKSTFQRTIYQSKSGAWIVEFRFLPDKTWNKAYDGRSKNEAQTIYNSLKKLNPTRFGRKTTYTKARIARIKWFSITAISHGKLIKSIVEPFLNKGAAAERAQNLIGKLYAGHEITEVVLDGPYASMIGAKNKVSEALFK